MGFRLELLMAVAMTTFGVFVASRIAKMDSFQVVVQMLLMPMLFLSGALFPLNGLPTWLAFITRLNPLTYAIAPFRQIIFDAQNMSAVAQAHFSTAVTWFGWVLPVWFELAIVVVFAAVLFVLAERGLSRLSRAAGSSHAPHRDQVLVDPAGSITHLGRREQPATDPQARRPSSLALARRVRPSVQLEET